MRESGYTDSNTLTANWTNTLVALPLLQGAKQTNQKKKNPGKASQSRGENSDWRQLRLFQPAERQSDDPQGSPPLRRWQQRNKSTDPQSRCYLGSFLSPDKSAHVAPSATASCRRNPTTTGTADINQRNMIIIRRTCFN